MFKPPVRALPQLLVHLPRRHELAFQDVPEEEIVVHGGDDDAGDFHGCEFYEGVVLGGAGGAVAREPEAGDGAELGEVGTHFLFVKPMRDAPLGRGRGSV